MQVVVFKLKDEQFAVETAKVQSISDPIKATKVPKAPDYIKGLINLRGSVISLLDINMLLDIGRDDNHDDSQDSIIILKIEEEQMGISVDQVDEVLDIDESIIEKVEDDLKRSYVKGVINFKDRIVTLIDIDKLLLS
ncbi:MAG: chemotaxis protein CheW [Bacillota bacterium]|nr:chemotaxis protein CheW [Bacillota bacterium]